MTAFLLVVGVLAAIFAVKFFAPFGPCPQCHGQRMIMRRSKTKPRPVVCPRCKGLARRQRPGSQLVHQLAERIYRYRRQQARSRTTSSAPTPEEID